MGIFEFLITAGFFFIIGSFFGVMIMGLMSASSIDSRERERMEENDEGKV